MMESKYSPKNDSESFGISSSRSSVKLLQKKLLHDKEELEDLMERIKDEIDAEFMDIVLGIERSC